MVGRRGLRNNFLGKNHAWRKSCLCTFPNLQPHEIKSQKEDEFGLYAVGSLWAGHTSKEICLAKPKPALADSQNLIKLFIYGWLKKSSELGINVFLSLRAYVSLIWISCECIFKGLGCGVSFLCFVSVQLISFHFKHDYIWNWVGWLKICSQLALFFSFCRQKVILQHVIDRFILRKFADVLFSEV